MVGYDGTPLPRDAMAGAEWTFDAIYTPIDTQFLTDARFMGLSAISGWELFLFQGLDAWGHFSGTPLNETKLRQSLASIGNTG